MTAPLRLTDRKREAIVQAAIAEFRANGFDVTSMDKIAATAEVSKRTVYNHFPSKEELFAEILHQLWARAVAQADTAYYADRPLRDQLRELLKTKMQTMSDESFLDLARVVTAATIHSPERAHNMVKRMSELEKPFNGWITAAQTDGRLKAVEPDFAAHQVYGLLKSFAFWPQITKGSPPLAPAMLSRVIESTLDLFLGWYEITPSADR